MQQDQQEFRRELRQIALSVARTEKRPAVGEEALGEPVVSTDPMPPPPPPPLQQRATPTTAPLFAPLQAGMRPDISGTAVVGSGQTAGGSGAARFDGIPAGTGPQIPRYEQGEGSNRSVDTRKLGLWQYEKFVKNGGRPFFGKLDAEEAFLWISSAIGVFDTMACPMEHRVRIITGAFQDEARIWWSSVQNSIFAHRQPQDITWEEFRAEFDGKYFPPNIRKRKEREFQTLRQGPMTVVQYETRFRALERFAPDLVSTEERRIERFYEGLHHEIRMAYLDRKFATFGDVVRAAGEAERVIAARPHQDVDQRQQHSRPYQPEQGEQQRHQSDAPVAMRAMDAQVQGYRAPFCQNCRRRHGGECRAGTNTCYRCGQRGHRAAECSVGTDVCYSCGQLGHRAATCSTGQTQQVTLPAPRQRLALPGPQQQPQQTGRDQQPPRQQQRGLVAIMTGQEHQALDQRGMQTTPPLGPSISVPPWTAGMDTATIAEALEDTTNVTGTQASHLRFHI